MADEIHIKTAVIQIGDIHYLLESKPLPVSDFTTALYSIIGEAKYERQSHADVREHSLPTVIGHLLVSHMGCKKIDYSKLDIPHKLFQIEDEKVISY
jgi:hypothetical protein